MKTEFRYHEHARLGLRAWIAELSARDPGGQEMVEVILADIRELLLLHGANVPGVIPDRNSDPILYWLRYYPGYWLSYVVIESGFWRWRKRRVIVYSVGDPPPDRVLASSPRA